MFGTARGEEPAPGPQQLACPAALAARDSVVLMADGASFRATGFVFGDARTVATAAHVGANRAFDRQGRIYSLRRIAIDRAHDIAIYEVDRPIVGATPFNPGTAKIGLAVFSVGHPNGSETTEWMRPGLYRWSIVHGMIIGATKDWVLTDFVPADGASGSPLVDCDGAVLGVLSANDGGSLYTVFGNAMALATLYATRHDVADTMPSLPARFVADIDIALDVEVLHDQIGAELGFTWVRGGVFGLREVSAFSTNALTGDLRGSGRVNHLRLALDAFAGWPNVLGSTDMAELTIGAGWTRSWTLPLAFDGPTDVKDHLVPRLGLRYYVGRVFTAIQAEAELGNGFEPSVWFQLGYWLGPL